MSPPESATHALAAAAARRQHGSSGGLLVVPGNCRGSRIPVRANQACAARTHRADRDEIKVRIIGN